MAKLIHSLLQNKKTVFLSIVLIMTLTRCTNKNIAVYSIDRACENFPDVKLLTLAVTDSATYINFSYTNSNKATALVGLAAPGHKSAYYIEDIEGKHQYKLIDIKYMPVLPHTYELKTSATMHFSIKLEKIDTGMKKLNLIHGQEQYKGENDEWIHWHFYNIELTTPCDDCIENVELF